MAVSPGTRLGAYEVIDLLGAGGMGEVWRARDVRLGREVALKILPARFADSPARLARLEREARLLAALNHPRIATLYGFEESGGTPALVMELVEGSTLAARLQRGPLPLVEALELAREIAEALEAAHEKGILHRDLKPSNVRLTLKGQVKLLDFGLAQALEPAGREPGSLLPPSTLTTDASSSRGVAGTAPYMSPEQARGEEVDRRSDLWAFGCVLYEMLTGRRAFAGGSAAEAVAAVLEREPEWGALPRGTPPAVLELLERCLRKGREERIRDAGDARLELEELLGVRRGRERRQGEEPSPYPGLRSFTEKDAGVFFGREGEVESLWSKLRERRLLAVIGPSGAGKTSFLRAGVIPARPEGWGAVCATPGANPGLGLARALTLELAGDAEAMGALLSGVAELTQDAGGTERVVSAVRRWKARHAEALVIVDQFEELFTLNPPETQERFAILLARLASEADVHVVLSLRDDFLMRCHDQEPLAPVFFEITPLGALTREGLRRALVEPARKLGYRFEDDALAEEMVESVEGARAVLPLLAFSVARLWEMRDREKKLLTRGAYQAIGGVAGALAQHAEATLDRIGAEHQGLVREILRHLVTALGTRAVIDREELLSAFPDRAAAEEVLRLLVDARLLTSYEVEGKGGEPSRHRVEIVHESLLKAWPRLVRWQTQDEDGAQLRDQLKQAAHLWEEKGRTTDLLWTGTAYQEYELWRRRYAGGLTALEEDFARSMADNARRKRRLLTAAVASVIVALAGIAIAIGISRRQTARALVRAEAETQRAEAGKLLALGRTEIDRDPASALAYARRSLELADTPDARRFAVEVLWRGPVARILSPDRAAGGPDQPETPFSSWPDFSPDAKWLALGRRTGRGALLFPDDGGMPRAVPLPPDARNSIGGFGPQSDLLVADGPGTTFQLLSLPDLREIRSFDLGGFRSWGRVIDAQLVTTTQRTKGDLHWLIRGWSLPGGDASVLGTIDMAGVYDTDIDLASRSLVTASGSSVYRRALGDEKTQRLLGRHPNRVTQVSYFPRGDRLASVDANGEIRLWGTGATAAAPLRILQGPKSWGRMFSPPSDPTGTYVAYAGLLGASSLRLWDLRDPPDAAPVVLNWLDAAQGAPGGSFEPSGRWLVMANGYRLGFWPLANPWRRVLPGHTGGTFGLSFTPDGQWLAQCPQGRDVRLWPLNPGHGEAHPLLLPEPSPKPSYRSALSGCNTLAIDPTGTRLAVATQLPTRILLLPIAGGSSRLLRTAWEAKTLDQKVAFDPVGRRLIACPGAHQGIDEARLRSLMVWDLDSGRSRSVSLVPFTEATWSCDSVAFAPDGALLVAGNGGLLRVVASDDERAAPSVETLYAAGRAAFALDRDGRKLLVRAGRGPGANVFEELLLFDLPTRTSRRITSHGRRLWTADFDPSGRAIVTGDNEGVVRIGLATGEEPHLLLGGHSGQVQTVAVSPDGRWVASASDDTLNLWPMPDVAKPPLQSLPYDSLMAKLDALTNVRVVRDPTSSTGWKIELGPFPGWKDVPTW